MQTCIPFAQTEPLAVSIPINDIDMVDIYIDDTIGVAPDKNDNIRCVSATIPLAIHCITCPLDPLDEIPQKEIISLKKFVAEGWPSEIKTVLGWIINNRTLTIALPLGKYSEWCQDINTILSKGRANNATLKSLLSRLNHVAFLMDMLRHFMSRLWMDLLRTMLHKFTYLQSCEKDNVK